MVPNKPRKPSARPLNDLVAPLLADAFERRGFAATQLVTHWSEIVGAEIAAHTQPIEIRWPHAHGDSDGEAGVLVLRVEGPAAIEIQHLAPVVLERVNRVFGWRAVGRIAFKQAPLRRARGRAAPPAPDPAARERIAAMLTEVKEDGLRDALSRLGAAIKRS